MKLLWMILFGCALIKLSFDDHRMHRVYHTDLIVLCFIGLILFEDRALSEWIVMAGAIFVLALIGQLKGNLGSGDLAVILALGLTLDLVPWLNVLSVAAVSALGIALIIKKAHREEMPFVPYLGLGWMVIYLIRLRLIFS